MNEYTVDTMIVAAADLFDQEGKNEEYNSALIALIGTIIGLSSDEWDLVALLIKKEIEINNLKFTKAIKEA